jgi:hypothetical protein
MDAPNDQSIKIKRKIIKPEEESNIGYIREANIDMNNPAISLAPLEFNHLRDLIMAKDIKDVMDKQLKIRNVKFSEYIFMKDAFNYMRPGMRADTVDNQHPSSIQSMTDYTNTIKAISIPHKKCGIDMKDILSTYNKRDYDNYREQFLAKIDDASDGYVCKKNIESLDELSDILNKQKLNKVKIDPLKLMNIGVPNTTDTLTPIVTNLYQKITELNFWIEIEKLNYKDRNECLNINSWNIDAGYVLYLMNTEIYLATFTKIKNILQPFLTEERITNTGIIHHIIFKGRTYYNYILDSPDFILYELDEHVCHDIPRYLRLNN